MAETKTNKRRKLLYLSVFVFFALVLLLIELFNVRFSEDQTLHDMIYGIITRAIGSVICVLMILYSSLGNIFSLGGKLKKKIYLLIVPCWLVAINNFPFIAVFNGSVSLEREWQMVVLLAIECLFVGFFEECAFRGCVFLIVLEGRHKNRKDVFWSIVISSVIFGAVHIVNLFTGSGVGAVVRQLGYSALIGAMCSVVLLLTHEIWSCVLLHAVFNFAGAIMTTLGKGEIWNLPTIIITAALAVAVTVYMIVLFLKYDVSTTEELFAAKRKRALCSEGEKSE